MKEGGHRELEQPWPDSDHTACGLTGGSGAGTCSMMASPCGIEELGDYTAATRRATAWCCGWSSFAL